MCRVTRGRVGASIYDKGVGRARSIAAVIRMAPTTPTGAKRVLKDAETTPQKAPKHRSPVSNAKDDVVEAIDRPSSLAIGTLIEAKDEEMLWYPAHVADVAGREVRVHFDGWEDQWDEWIPKNSNRLRRHRGWGTDAMPKDWQQDSTIEALDMEGKWYKAKVLHVSELACKVHYNGWPSKWDEWVRKDSGRCDNSPAEGDFLKLSHTTACPRHDHLPAASGDSYPV